MAVARLRNITGVLIGTDPVRVIDFSEDGLTRIIKLATLYSPNATTAAVVTWRWVWEDSGNVEQVTRRFPATVPVNDAWIFGSLGAIMVVNPRQAVELQLSAVPDTHPIEYSIDVADA